MSPALKKVLLVFWIPILFTAVLQGIVAYCGNVFDEDGLISQIHALKNLGMKQTAEEYLRERDTLTKLLKEVNTELTLDASNQYPFQRTTISELLQVKERIEAQLELLDNKPTVVLIPFYPRPYMFLYTPLAMALLSLLCFGIFKPIKRPDNNSLDNNSRLSPGRVILFGFALYSPFLVGTWIRQILTMSRHGNPAARRVFAYANIDIWWPSFVTQEAIGFGICCLLGMCWWLWYQSGIEEQKKTEEKEKASNSDLVGQSRLLMEAYLRWIVCSTILGVGFFSFTSFYWYLVRTYDDYRYIADAVTRHLLWGCPGYCCPLLSIGDGMDGSMHG